MIEKPVSCIMKIEPYASGSHNGIYTTASKTLDYAMGDAKDGDLIFINAKTRLTFNPIGETLVSASYANGIWIYKKINDTKLVRLCSQKPLKASDLHHVNYVGAKDDVDFYIKLSGYTYCCDEEYGITFEVRNDELFMQQFKNLYKESYVVGADKCCSYCSGEKSVNQATITYALYKEWLANKDNSMLTAQMIADMANSTKIYDNTAGKYYAPSDDSTALTGDAAALMEAVAKAVTGLSSFSADVEIENDLLSEDAIKAISDWNNFVLADLNTYSEADLINTAIVFHVTATEEYSYGQMNFKYVKNRSTRMSAYKLSGLKCSGELVTNNDEGYTSGDITIGSNAIGKYSIGQTDGYDLKQLEYEFMGWMEKSPYRLSDITMSEMGMEYSFDAGTYYDVLVIAYEQVSDAPWGHFEHPEELVLAAKSHEKITSNNKYLYELAAFFGLAVSNYYDTAYIDFK